MSENRNNIARMWFKKADNDLKNIENNLSANDIPVDTVCFHAQQSIEKYLKGTLIYFEQGISKTHDLVKLLSEVVDFIPELSASEEELEEVSGFAVEVRYPDTFYNPTLEEAKKAYEIALKVKKIILDKIKVIDS